MINVKGTKNALPEADASQRYVLKSGDEVSGTPRVIVGLLMGIAAYLGSIFTWGRESEPQSQPEEPAAGAAEAESQEGMVDDIASPQPSPDMPDPEPPGSATPLAADAPGSSPLRYQDKSEGAPAVKPASGNAAADRIDRRDGSPGTLSINSANPASNRSSSPRNDNPPAEGKDPTDGDGSTDSDGSTDNDSSTDSDPLDPEDEDDDAEAPPGGNRAPRVSGPVYLLDVAPCAALVIDLSDLLSKAEDPDGDALSVQNVTVSSGTLTQTEGGWVFQSGSGQPGPVTLTYQITDGELTTDAVAHFSVVEPPVIAGSAADDMLLGSLCADEIDGAGGDDNIDGRAGSDVINGGAGDDHIVAGDGDDVVFGGDGNDIIFGGAGNDHLFGGAGDDRLFGGDGDDVIFGNAGEDHLSGGDGDDLLLGGEGDDVLMDGAGRDKVFGGMGSDRVVAALDAADDVYDGGENSDTLDYSHATESLVVDLVNGVASGVEIGHDAITGFEKVLGGRDADQFILGSEAVTLTGGTGDDVFAFASAGGVQPNAVSHVIMDFGVGDRIRISEYEIFWKADDEPEDRFEHIYRDNDDDDSPIRYRHDRDDGSEWTVIETDFEDDELWASTVTLHGRHKLSWSIERDDGHEWLS
ncbi:cadherin-like domain-containing protein [Vreelandella lionensis]|uniref:Cadherin-like domain-containing protein n=1 Tax=Vreelandella lionensis TaxID=1144478 RepID=A0ABW8BWN9_9GAMM